MIGNYPVNDDWIFLRQVEAFNQGIYSINARLDPSFIAQGLLGLLWGKIFGISFLSLQILTILITLLGLIFFIKILKLLNIKKELVIILSLLFLFNPIVFNSTFSFMTDNYFLTFLIISTYFFLRNKDRKDILLGSLFMLFASLTRQIGIFIGISYLFSYFYGVLVEKKEINRRKVSMVLVGIVLGVLIPFYWPDYGSNRMFILQEDILFRLKQWLLSIYYFPLFAFPLFFGLKRKKTTKFCRVVFIVVWISLTLVLYHLDIFAVGNVLYIENLHTKSDFKSNFSLFDNIFFKLGLSSLIALSFTKLITFVKEKAKCTSFKVKCDCENLFLFSLGILNFVVLLISSDFYDRYLLPSFVVFLFLFVKKYKDELSINWFTKFSLILLIFISFTLQWEFSTKTRFKWEQASMLEKETGYYKQIDLDDTYRKYAATVKENDYTGFVDTKVFDKECYVQEYTLDGDSVLLKNVQRFENKIDKKILKKRKPLSVNKKEIPRVKNNLDTLMFNKEYFSITYNLVGKRAYVGSWCVSE